MLKAWVTLVSFWHRATHMDNNTFVKKAVTLLMENDVKESEWIGTIRLILRKFSLERYFYTPSDIAYKA